MDDQSASIIYEVYVNGMARLEELSAQTALLNAQNQDLTNKLKQATSANDVQDQSLQRSLKSLMVYRRELMLFVIAIVAVTAVMKALANASDVMKFRLEQQAAAWQKVLRPIGEFAAKYTNWSDIITSGPFGLATVNQTPGLSDQMNKELYNMQIENAKLRGDTSAALNLKLASDEVELNKKIEKLLLDRQQIFRQEFEQKRMLMLADQHLAELGLQKQVELDREMKKNLIGDFTAGTSSSIQNFLQGKSQSPADLLKNFTDPLTKTISDYIAKSLSTFIFGKDKNLEEAARQRSEMVSNLKDINSKCDCMCQTVKAVQQAGNQITNAVGSFGGSGGLVSIAGNLVSSAAGGGGGGFSSLASTVLGLAGPALGGGSGAAISIAAGALERHHAGGFVGAFATGGEVPALVQPGEFVVNRAASQQNKDLLESVNSGKKVQGTQNVFMIKTNDAGSFASLLATPAGRNEISNQLVRLILNNGDVRKILKEFTK